MQKNREKMQFWYSNEGMLMLQGEIADSTSPANAGHGNFSFLFAFRSIETRESGHTQSEYATVKR